MIKIILMLTFKVKFCFLWISRKNSLIITSKTKYSKISYIEYIQ
jgi:hypothetical protein